jgi:hypothetical protein
LGGGGFHPVNNTSLYPGNDIDMAFDLNISPEDLVLSPTFFSVRFD